MKAYDMTYSESAEGVIISPTRARKELRDHGLEGDYELFAAEVATDAHGMYNVIVRYKGEIVGSPEGIPCHSLELAKSVQGQYLGRGVDYEARIDKHVHPLPEAVPVSTQFKDIPVRFFTLAMVPPADDEFADFPHDEVDIVEITEACFIALEGEITYERNTMFENGCSQIALTVHSLDYPALHELELVT